MESLQHQMMGLISGYWISQSVNAAAELRLADLIQSGMTSSTQLAEATGTHAPSLYRLLRALASVGVFAEGEHDRFRLTPLAETLLDRPGSQRAVAILMGGEHYASWGELLYSIRTGKPSFDKIYGMPAFDYLSKHPEQAKNFDAAMVGVHGAETQAMLDAYDFSGIGVLMDVGGGNGSLLTATLKRYPHLRGILFDLPHTVERAREQLIQQGMQARCSIKGGSFFEMVPEGGDAYLMRHIIHDWNDEQSITILKNIRRVIKPDGRVLLVEAVIPPGNEPSWSKFLDLNMMVIPGGMERNDAQYRSLFERSGFTLNRIVPTATEVSVIEALPA